MCLQRAVRLAAFLVSLASISACIEQASTIEVKALDNEGAEDPSPAKVTLSLALIAANKPPTTAITSGPPDGATSSRGVRFEASGADADGKVASFVYSLDGGSKKNVDADANGKAVIEFSSALGNLLSPGNHSVAVASIDNLGARDASPATSNAPCHHAVVYQAPSGGCAFWATITSAVIAHTRKRSRGSVLRRNSSRENTRSETLAISGRPITIMAATAPTTNQFQSHIDGIGTGQGIGLHHRRAQCAGARETQAITVAGGDVRPVRRGVHRERRRMPRPGGQAGRERAQHHDRVLGVVDLRAVANQVGGADNAERARQAGADDEHDQRADDGEHDLRLHHGRLPLRRAAAARPQCQYGAENGGQRQAERRRQQLLL